MIKKTLRKDDTVQVSFYTEALPGAESVHLVGSFNGWHKSAHPMRRLKGDRFMAMRRFDLNSRHEYRYLVDGEIWVNDAEADSYTPNPFGSDNSVVTTDLPAPAEEPEEAPEIEPEEAEEAEEAEDADSPAP